MAKEIRYFRLPPIQESGLDISVPGNDLYLTEAGEIEVEEGTIWSGGSNDSFMLAFCTRGEGIVLMAGEQVPVTGDQFFIIPRGEIFKFYSVLKKKSHFLVAGFNGKNVKHMSREFMVVRNLVPSVNNMVANREMLFEEIFNNLSKIGRAHV